MAHAVPLRVLGAGGAQDPVADRNDQTGLLGHREEVRRRDQAQLGMLPAQQRLGADDAAAGEVELGLIVEDEALLLEGRAQAVLDRHAPLDGRVHVVGEELESVAAAVLGVEQRGIRLLDELLGVPRIAGEGRDSDAAAQRRRLAAELDRLAERGQQLARHGRGVELVREVRQQNRELVAAQSCGSVRFAQAGVQAPRDAPKQPIADRTAERIVDRFEPVDVQGQDGVLVAPAASGRDRLAQAIQEERAVGEAGEWIVGGEVTGTFPRVAQLQDRSMALQGGGECGGEQAWSQLVPQQSAASAALECADREALVVGPAHHHDGDEGGAQVRLHQGGEIRALRRVEREEQHVGIPCLRPGQGLPDLRHVHDRELHGARAIQQLAHGPGLPAVAADQQYEDSRRGAGGFHGLVHCHSERPCARLPGSRRDGSHR
jgi:hypothetical protein